MPRSERLVAVEAFEAALAARPPTYRPGATATATAAAAGAVLAAPPFPAHAARSQVIRVPRPPGRGRQAVLGNALCAAGLVVAGWGATVAVTAARASPAPVPVHVDAAPLNFTDTPSQSGEVTPPPAPPRGAVADRPPPGVRTARSPRLTPPAAVRTPASAAAPVEVVARGLRAPVVPVGLTRRGALDVPRPSVAGWWRGGVRPGERGPAVLVGHVDTPRGPAVFFPLLHARPGDHVQVRRADGTVATFVVYRVATFRKSSFPTATVYGATPVPELRIVTCGGVFDRTARHYRDNIVVFARAVR